MLGLALGVMGAPAARAEGGSGGATETSAPSAPATPAASSSADLHQRIDALKAELADLNAELAREKDGDSATSAAAPQGQGSTTPATTPPAETPAAAPAPAPLPTPSMAGPLATAVPHELGEGPFGKIDVTGILSGMGLTQSNWGAAGLADTPTHWDLSNAQVFIQKTTGWWQFYLQGGAYNIPALGASFVTTKNTIQNLYGPFPVGYLKLVKGNFNVEVGSLPTLIGAEYTFSFQNMNIERGLLWGLEPAISRGVQLSDTYKKLSVSFSWNDGFYSNRYSSLSGSLAWAFNASNTLSFVASGNAGSYAKSTNATPLLLNNSSVYNLIYMYSHGSLMIMPYYQYTDTKTNASIGIPQGAHTNGGALLVNYNFKHGISLGVRPEYIKSSGSAADPNEISLLYGPGSGAFSFTVTPTYIKDGFFLRGDFSIVHATNSTPGAVFGTTGLKVNQPRGVIEAGFMF
jgi:Putative beta-barrel porin-2, OmpL-like. bbp2